MLSVFPRLPVVSSILFPSGSCKDLERSLRSLLIQTGEFDHEIIIYGENAPKLAQTLPLPGKDAYCPLKRVTFVDSSACSLRSCLTKAKGQFTGLLAAPDYYLDPLKLLKQMNFLVAHPDCQMCFTDAHYFHKGNLTQVEKTWKPQLPDSGESIFASSLLSCTFLFCAAILPALDDFFLPNGRNISLSGLFEQNIFTIGFLADTDTIHYI